MVGWARGWPRDNGEGEDPGRAALAAGTAEQRAGAGAVGLVLLVIAVAVGDAPTAAEEVAAFCAAAVAAA